MSYNTEYSKKRYARQRESGICPRCNKKLDRDGYYCIKCLNEVNEYYRESRNFYKKIGICPQCRKEKLFGDEQQCISCRQKRYERRKQLTDEKRELNNKNFAKYSRALYKERSEQGICTRCGKRIAAPGKKKCVICAEKENEYNRLRYMKDKKMSIREYRAQNNLCYYCGNKIDLDKGKLCSKCLERCRENGKKSKSDNKFWRDENKIIFNRD